MRGDRTLSRANSPPPVRLGPSDDKFAILRAGGEFLDHSGLRGSTETLSFASLAMTKHVTHIQKVSAFGPGPLFNPKDLHHHNRFCQTSQDKTGESYLMKCSTLSN